MRTSPYLLMFLLLLGLSITARNQDSRLMESTYDPVFIVKAIYVDSEGVKWFGTNKGLCRYNNLTWTYYTDADYLVGNNVNALSFEETDAGNALWVATTQGISVVLFEENGVRSSRTYTALDGLLNEDVSDISIDTRMGKFFGSNDGIIWYHDGIMDSILYLDNYSYMFNTPVRKMDIYGDTLYLAQDGGIGRLISGVDGISGASRWDGDYGISPFSNDIKSIKIKGEDIQYFGTEVGVETHTGYFAKEGWDLFSTNEGLVNNNVISIAEDPESGMWFGTLGGVSNLSDGVWTSYTTNDGLLSDTVYDIGFDLDASIWFGTAAGACRLKDGVFQDFITAVPNQMTPGMQLFLAYNHRAETIQLTYNLLATASVSARLYNMSGMLVGTWMELPSLAGEHHVELTFPHTPGRGPLVGIYVMQMFQGTLSCSKKMLISYK